MASLARLLMVVGAVVAGAGLLLLLAAHWRLPLGHLPGDVVFRGPRATVYFPWVTMLVLSLLATVVLNLIFRR
ncbi:MAG: DUF2905 domain-containing protein [Terriglobales bacterium]